MCSEKKEKRKKDRQREYDARAHQRAEVQKLVVPAVKLTFPLNSFQQPGQRGWGGLWEGELLCQVQQTGAWRKMTRQRAVNGGGFLKRSKTGFPPMIYDSELCLVRPFRAQ